MENEKYLERNYLKHSRLTTYTMLENVDIDWHWEEREVFAFDEAFQEGWDIMQLAEKFNRTPDEIGLMIFDRAMQGKIKPRKMVV